MASASSCFMRGMGVNWYPNFSAIAKKAACDAGPLLTAVLTLGWTTTVNLAVTIGCGRRIFLPGF